QAVEHSAILGPNFVRMGPDVLFSEMFDSEIFQFLTEEHTLDGEAAAVIPTPVELDGAQFSEVVQVVVNHTEGEVSIPFRQDGMVNNQSISVIAERHVAGEGRSSWIR